jgi:protein gp37
MAQYSSIGWTGGSWNVNAGCFYEGKDCIRCYLAAAVIRLARISVQASAAVKALYFIVYV